MKGRLASALLVLCAVGCATRTVSIPDSLKPAPDESLAMVVPAKGVQIYECRVGQWAFVAPEAELFDRGGNRIGRHYAGPHWEADDGSKILGTPKARAQAPMAGAIPWLLLEAKSVGGEGVLSRVTSIQRVATAGGVAPAGTCAESGARSRVGYTADYYLYFR